MTEMRIPEYAEAHGVDRRTVLRWIEDGIVKARRAGPGRTSPWVIELTARQEDYLNHLKKIRARLDGKPEPPAAAATQIQAAAPEPPEPRVQAGDVEEYDDRGRLKFFIRTGEPTKKPGPSGW